MQINTYELHLEQRSPLKYLDSAEIIVNGGVGSYSRLDSGCGFKESGHGSKVWRVNSQGEVK